MTYIQMLNFSQNIIHTVLSDFLNNTHCEHTITTHQVKNQINVPQKKPIQNDSAKPFFTSVKY